MTTPDDVAGVASRLARKLGLPQSPSKDTMKQFARRTHELERQYQSLDRAAMEAAREIFQSDFRPNVYAGCPDSTEAILADIDGP